MSEGGVSRSKNDDAGRSPRQAGFLTKPGGDIGAEYKAICPICEGTVWQSMTQSQTYKYRNSDFTLNDVEFSRCADCGFDLVLPAQRRRNDARVRDEHKSKQTVAKLANPDEKWY